MPLTSLIAALALAGSAQCEAPALLKVPLDSTQKKHAVAVRGYTVDVAMDSPGWDVEVFSAADRRKHDNLLAPQSNWHGAFPFQVQPGSEALFGSVRRLTVRGGEALVCIRLNGPRVADERFVGGSLEVSWERSH